MQQINSRKNIIVSISSEYFNTVVSLLLSLCFYHHEQQRNSNTPCLLWKKKIPCSPFQQTQAESRNITTADKAQFIAHFGVTPYVCAYVWQALWTKMLVPRHGIKPYLLWALMFLKLYSTEIVLAGMAGTSPKTFKKWSITFINALSQLKPFVVSSF